MRRYLIDQARGHPGPQFPGLDGLEDCTRVDKTDVAVTVDQLLEELAKTKPDWAQVVEVKYFLGLNDEQAAEVLNLPLHTLQRMWSDARQWLANRMEALSGPRRTEAR